MRKVSTSGVGHPYNKCRHLVVLGYLVRVRERHMVGWIGEKSMCRHLVYVGVFSESESRDIWWVGLGVKGVT